MRSDDLHPDHTYVLEAGSRQRLVTVLLTEPELRRHARVRVRFQEGVKAGEEATVPTRQIITALTGPAVGMAAHPRRLPVARPPQVQREPVVGDQVTQEATGSLIWTVSEVADSKALIHTTIMERPATDTVELPHLRVVLPEAPKSAVEPSMDAARKERVAAELAREPEPSPQTRAPEKPRRKLDELLEAVIFSPQCISQYRRRFRVKGFDAWVLDQMRGLIRYRGYVVDDEPLTVDEYARIRVPHRFEVVLRSRPTPERSVRVDGLRFERSRSKRTRSDRAA